MEHIMSTEKKSIKVVAVTCLKDCSSILNLQPPVAGKYLSLTIIHTLVFLTPLQPLNSNASFWQCLANYSHHLETGRLRNADLSGRNISWASSMFMWDYRYETHFILINKKMCKPFVIFNCWCHETQEICFSDIHCKYVLRDSWVKFPDKEHLLYQLVYWIKGSFLQLRHISKENKVKPVTCA